MKIYNDGETYKKIIHTLRHTKIIGKEGSKRINYINIESAFDLEASSLYINEDEKGAYAYIWMFGVGEYVVYGRNLEEFVNFCNKLTKDMNLCEGKRLVVYVHNLSYDFQFIRKYFEWVNVFANKEREIIYGVTENGIEFRCSYRLTNMKLEDLAKEIKDIEIQKQVGSLDYNLTRNSLTPLSEQELKYCEYDILILLQYIREKLKYEDTITTIPLTKTGYVRRYCRNKCLENP